MKNASRAQVALVALVLFLFGVGGLFALSNRLVQTSKDQAWTPFSVASSIGVTRLKDDFMGDSLLLHIASKDTQPIVIKGVSAGGSSEMLFYGSETVGSWGHPIVDGNACDPEHNSARQCGIALASGETVAMQLYVPNGALCNRDFTEDPYSPPSINSVRKSAASTLVVYYQYAVRNPAVEDNIASALVKAATGKAQSANGLLSKTFRVTAECFDYWLCTPDEYISQPCMQRYETNKAHWCVKGGCGYSFVG